MLGLVSGAVNWLWEWLEFQIDTAFVKMDIAFRWALGDIPEEIVRFFFEGVEHMQDFVEGLTSKTDPNAPSTDVICIDEEGLHFINEEWTPEGTCIFRKCVAHDTIKEIRCPEIPPMDHRCWLKKGDKTAGWPACCDSVVCPPYVDPPLQKQPKNVYWRYQSYKHLFG